MEATAARGMAATTTATAVSATAAPRPSKRVPRRRQCQYSRESD
jgi:hypothetical protein